MKRTTGTQLSIARAAAGGRHHGVEIGRPPHSAGHGRSRRQKWRRYWRSLSLAAQSMHSALHYGSIPMKFTAANACAGCSSLPWVRSKNAHSARPAATPRRFRAHEIRGHRHNQESLSTPQRISAALPLARVVDVPLRIRGESAWGLDRRHRASLDRLALLSPLSHGRSAP